MSVKIERINDNLQEAISYIIFQEVKNPNIKFVTITAVDTTSDFDVFASKIPNAPTLDTECFSLESLIEVKPNPILTSASARPLGSLVSSTENSSA